MASDGLHQNATLTGRQKKALSALLYQPNVSQVAKSLKLHRATLHRWLRDPVFASELERLRAGLVVDAVHRIKASLGLAVSGLITQAVNGTGASKVRACEILLEHGLSANQIEEMRSRLTRLECLLETYKEHAS